MNSILGELLSLVLIITFAPIIIGVAIAFIIGASGLVYFSIVSFTCIIFWAIILLWWSL